MNKEYPIIFNTEMVKAVLDGRKTQARMIPSSQNAKWKVGDRLWVNESYFAYSRGMELTDIELEIIGLRKEKLFSITVEDVMAEGCPERDSCCSWFGLLWDNCYTQTGQRWADNPEVQVVEFRRVK